MLSPLQTLFSQKTSIQENANPKINILGRDEQLNRYKMLDRDDLLSNYHGEYQMLICDRFKDCVPSSLESRIFVRKDTPTNGATVCDGNVVISGPQNRQQSELLWSICAEKVMGAIVRIGVPAPGESCAQHKTCCTYTPTPDKPIKFTKDDGIDFPFIISQPNKEKTTIPLTSITQTQYQIQYGSSKNEIAYFAVEDWEDMKGYSVDKLFSLIDVLGTIKKPILVHCRGGMGRSAVVILCLKIFKDFLEAKSKGEKTMDIDPAGLVKNLRDSRRLAVQNDEQFEFILRFIDHINSVRE